MIHTPPYTPRGKIERFFRTVRSQFPPCFHGETLEELNIAMDELIRTPPKDLEDHFRKEIRRRINKDRSVSIDNRIYEAPTRLIGEQVSLLYHEHKKDKVEIIFKGTSQGFLVIDLQVNAQIKRTLLVPLNGFLTKSIPYRSIMES